MEKLVYVLWKRERDSPEAFAGEMLEKTADRLLDLGARGLSLNLADEAAARAAKARITRLDPPPSGALCFWLDAADDRAPFEAALAGATSRTAGYLVVESVPLRNTTHTAPLGERTPGINLVSCIEKPDRLSWEDWIDHWHGPHRRVALEIQCTFRYVRNVVVRRLTDGAPLWSGIVEEGFPAGALTDPMIWYCADGSKQKLQENLERMLGSVRGFLDIDRVESHPMSEYRLKD